MAPRLRLVLTILVSLSCLCTLITADSPTNYFTYPAINDSLSSIPNQGHVTLVEGTKTVITWDTNFGSGSLYLSQSGYASSALLPDSYNLGAGAYIWVVDISGTGGNPTFDLSKGAEFTFSIVQNGTDEAGVGGGSFQSGAFTIVSSYATAAASTSAASRNAAPTLKGLGKGAQIGLGIGLVAILGIWALE